MNTRQLTRSLNNNIIFGGVFPKDIFISTPLTEGIHIVNTDPASLPGAHWFVVEKNGDNAMIFDSYGAISPVATEMNDIVTHIARYCRNIDMNIPTLQSLDSNVCGDYCLLYTAAREYGYSTGEILLSLLQFSSSHLRDHAVRHFISNNFSNTLPNSGFGFERVHVFP